MLRGLWLETKEFCHGKSMQVPRATCQHWAAAKHLHIDWDVRVWPECSLQAFATRERFFSALRALSPAAMAETPASLTSTTRPQASVYIITYLSIDFSSMFAYRRMYANTCAHTRTCIHECDENASTLDKSYCAFV